MVFPSTNYFFCNEAIALSSSCSYCESHSGRSRLSGKKKEMFFLVFQIIHFNCSLASSTTRQALLIALTRRNSFNCFPVRPSQKCRRNSFESKSTDHHGQLTETLENTGSFHSGVISFWIVVPRRNQKNLTTISLYQKRTCRIQWFVSYVYLQPKLARQQQRRLRDSQRRKQREEHELSINFSNSVDQLAKRRCFSTWFDDGNSLIYLKYSKEKHRDRSTRSLIGIWRWKTMIALGCGISFRSFKKKEDSSLEKKARINKNCLFQFFKRSINGFL